MICSVQMMASNVVQTPISASHIRIHGRKKAIEFTSIPRFELGLSPEPQLLWQLVSGCAGVWLVASSRVGCVCWYLGLDGQSL